MRLFHAAVNAPDVVCCVCDQFLPIFKSKLVSPSSLPPAFFEKLKKPTGQNGELEMLKYCIRSSRNSITFLISLPTTALDLTSCYCRLAELRNTYRLQTAKQMSRLNVIASHSCASSTRSALSVQSKVVSRNFPSPTNFGSGNYRSIYER